MSYDEKYLWKSKHLVLKCKIEDITEDVIEDFEFDLKLWWNTASKEFDEAFEKLGPDHFEIDNLTDGHDFQLVGMMSDHWIETYECETYAKEEEDED